MMITGNTVGWSGLADAQLVTLNTQGAVQVT